MPDSGSDEPETVETPVFEPNVGQVEKGTEVTIACSTENAAIYYTTNGSEPTDSDEEYISPIVVNKAMTVKAIAINGKAKSAVAQASFTVKNDPVGIETLTGAEFRLYPNPSSGNFVVETADESFVEVLTLQGVPVVRLEGVKGRKEISLRISGMYLVRVTDRKGTAVQRMVIK